jgi:hypothetical protein
MSIPRPNSSHKDDPFAGVRMETCKEIRLRYGFTPKKLNRKLNQFKGEFPARRGPTGRILEMRVTPELGRFLKGLA